MDIYITDISTNDRLRFPMLPQKIKVTTGSIFQSYTILAIGDVKLPAGKELTGFSWDGILPGKARQYEPYLFDWIDPREIQSLWSVYREKKKKLRLLVTETPINHDVYLERYTVDYSGGYGDYAYNISFIQAVDLIVYESGAGGETNDDLGQQRTSPPPMSTYTVAKGDSLWKIAQKLLGDGSKYSQLYEVNKDIIGKNPSLIYPGQIFTIP